LAQGKESNSADAEEGGNTDYLTPPLDAMPGAVARTAARETKEAKPKEAPPLRFLTGKALADAVAQRLRSKRRSLLTDEQLRRQLLQVPELRLNKVPGTSKGLVSASAQLAASGADVVPAMIARRADLSGLKSRAGNEARISRDEALTLKLLAQHLRIHMDMSMPGLKDGAIDLRPDPKILRERLLENSLRDTWLQPASIPALRQLLVHEQQSIRLILVDALALLKGPQASVALAERAIFDPHPDVRLAAVVALSSRPASEYEPLLIHGLGYPWPAVADHAAEALVALDRKEAVPKLIPLLDTRDPGAPYTVETGKKPKPVIPELVRINHLRNCLLCHFPSFSPLDPIRGPVPDSARRLPVSALGGSIPSASNKGGGGSWGGSRGGSGGKSKYETVWTWVRADITYVKQDFSVQQPVPNHGPKWPAEQRFDYLVRMRPLGKEEITRWRENPGDVRPIPPQREALLFALRELTGEDPGPTAEDWKRWYSPITGNRLPEPLDAEGQALLLRDALVEAPPSRQTELLPLFKERTGATYDRALILAIPSLATETQKFARIVLADRLFASPVGELRNKLCDEEPEVRRAAIRACRVREEKPLVPDLIALLDDARTEVAEQVAPALRQLTGRDFGPVNGASPEQRRQAMTAWREWWEEQEQKRALQK
jgi:HEAT repeat protein